MVFFVMETATENGDGRSHCVIEIADSKVFRCWTTQDVNSFGKLGLRIANDVLALVTPLNGATIEQIETRIAELTQEQAKVRLLKQNIERDILLSSPNGSLVALWRDLKVRRWRCLARPRGIPGKNLDTDSQARGVRPR